MRRFLSILLAILCAFSMLSFAVYAEDTEEENSPRGGDKLTHLELLEQLCTGFPYVGYEKYPEPPLYFQQDYGHVTFGRLNVTLATHGCGVTTLAMLASYMTDTEITPEDTAAQFVRYCTELGTAYALFDDSPGVLGYYLQGRAQKWEDVEAALKNGQMVISFLTAGHFTGTGHFLVLYGLTEEGKVLIKDSNVANYTHRFAGTDYYENGFDPAFVHQYNRIYWIYEKKVVRVPGCDRCADPAVETAPICIRPHYCARCAELLNKQAIYKSLMTTEHDVPVQ